MHSATELDPPPLVADGESGGSEREWGGVAGSEIRLKATRALQCVVGECVNHSEAPPRVGSGSSFPSFGCLACGAAATCARSKGGRT